MGWAMGREASLRYDTVPHENRQEPTPNAQNPPRAAAQLTSWPYLLAPKLCHPCPCRPKKKTLYVTPSGAFRCSSSMDLRRLCHRSGEVSMRPNERLSCWARALLVCVEWGGKER